MQFEKAEKGSRAGQATISLRKSNGIGINSTALTEYFEDVEYVEVLFDSEESVLALHPVGNSENGYKLSRVNSSASVTPTSFLKAKDLVPDVTKQFEPYTMESDEESEEYICIDVDDPVGTYGEPDSE